MMNTTCYRLVVCEKPSVARSIAAVLGAGRREEIGRASCRERV